MIWKQLLLCLLLPFAISSDLQAQGGYRGHKPLQDYYSARAIGGERVVQRLSVGIGKHIVPGSMTFAYNGYDTSGTPLNVTLKSPIRSRRSYLLHVGTFFPIALVSDQSIIALNTELQYSYVALTNDTVRFNSRDKYAPGLDIHTFGIPVSIDYKTGGDVSLSKKRTFLTLGGGINFSYITVLVDGSDYPYAAIPFVKAELGFFAGIAIKLRGVASFGRATYVDRKTEGLYGRDYLHTVTNSGYGYHISVVFMPFSYGWRSEEWY